MKLHYRIAAILVVAFLFQILLSNNVIFKTPSERVLGRDNEWESERAGITRGWRIGCEKEIAWEDEVEIVAGKASDRRRGEKDDKKVSDRSEGEGENETGGTWRSFLGDYVAFWT